ncbi:hypothetical protein CBS147372_9613 [Penicillium roqueforti]|nr:hypothetical protein CBS147372_9613 [Penicillium roqueforti]
MSTLQSNLCARWHPQRQAEQVGQQWTRLAQSDNTDRPPSHGLSQDPPVPLSTILDLVQPVTPFVTAEMLRTNSVSWHVSPARPAILTSVTNIWAGVQDLSLQNLSLSEDVDEIHGVFCLTEDEEQATECVILRCDQCRARNEGSLDALIVQSEFPRQASHRSIESLSASDIQHQINLVKVSSLSDQWGPHGCQSSRLGPVAQSEWQGFIYHEILLHLHRFAGRHD